MTVKFTLWNSLGRLRGLVHVTTQIARLYGERERSGIRSVAQVDVDLPGAAHADASPGDVLPGLHRFGPVA